MVKKRISTNIIYYVLILIFTSASYYFYLFASTEYKSVLFILPLIFAVGAFVNTNLGVGAISFLKNVKLEYLKIHFANAQESQKGLVVVFVFGIFFLFLISFFDFAIENVYSKLMF